MVREIPMVAKNEYTVQCPVSVGGWLNKWENTTTTSTIDQVFDGFGFWAPLLCGGGVVRWTIAQYGTSPKHTDSAFVNSVAVIVGWTHDSNGTTAFGRVVEYTNAPKVRESYLNTSILWTRLVCRFAVGGCVLLVCNLSWVQMYVCLLSSMMRKCNLWLWFAGFWVFLAW